MTDPWRCSRDWWVLCLYKFATAIISWESNVELFRALYLLLIRIFWERTFYSSLVFSLRTDEDNYSCILSHSPRSRWTKCSMFEDDEMKLVCKQRINHNSLSTGMFSCFTFSTWRAYFVESQRFNLVGFLLCRWTMDTWNSYLHKIWKLWPKCFFFFFFDEWISGCDVVVWEWRKPS